MFDPQLVGEAFEVLGEVLLGVMVLLVHTRLMKEKRVDRKIIQEIKEERNVGIIAIALILTGYLLKLMT